MRGDAEPPAAYSADARRCRGRDVPRSPATGVVHDPAAVTMRALDAPIPRATDRRRWHQERHLGQAVAAFRADDGQRPRPAACEVTRARRSWRSQAATEARTSRCRVGIGSCTATRVRRLRLSDRRHARRPLPAPTQAPEQRVGHRPPRTHRRYPFAEVPRPTPVRNHVSQPVLDASAKNVTRPSQFAGTASSGVAVGRGETRKSELLVVQIRAPRQIPSRRGRGGG